MDLIAEYGTKLAQTFWRWESRLAVFYLCAAVVIAFSLWLYRGRPTSFLRFLMPREVYFHKSNLIDLQVFVVNVFLGTIGLLGALTFTPLMAALVLSTLIEFQPTPFQPLDVTWGRSALATLIMILALDFCKYWVHYIHHENRVLWPLHALHHSAEVLTPLTVSRRHPLYVMFQSVVISVIVGAVVGVVLFALIGEISLLTIGGANAGYFLFNLLGANLRHSHIWLSYGRVLEHIFISPAQHQVHHSSAKKHFNKNYGEVFAFWDWMFGTLYLTGEYEKLDFGLADAKGNKIEQPHGTLKDALIKPFFEALEEATGIEMVQARAKNAPGERAR